ncbi:MAG: hypothetical protein WBF43_04800 [Methylocella sp.]
MIRSIFSAVDSDLSGAFAWNNHGMLEWRMGDNQRDLYNPAAFAKWLLPFA